jgi:hypothetical protein
MKNPVKRSLDKLYKPSRIEHKAAEKKQAIELLEMRETACIELFDAVESVSEDIIEIGEE